MRNDSGTGMWGSTSLGRGGVFSELREQFHSGRTPGFQWSNIPDGISFSKILRKKSVHIDVDQICCVPDDVFMIILIKQRKNVAVHTATLQDSCERDHESGILESTSFTVVQ